MIRRRGLTLVEVTVALAVGGVALAAAGAALSTLVDRRAAALEASDADTRAFAARRAVTDWLAAVRVGPGLEVSAVRRVRRTAHGAVADDSLAFVTVPGGVRQRVHLFVAREGAGGTLLAVTESAQEGTTRIVLADPVVGLEAGFLSEAFGTRRWHRGWDGALLPDAVTLRVQGSAAAPLPLPLQLPITVPLRPAP